MLNSTCFHLAILLCIPLHLFDELVKVDASSEGCIGQIDVLRMLSELHTKEMTIQVLEARVQKMEAAGDNTSNKMPQVREVFLHFTCIIIQIG